MLAALTGWTLLGFVPVLEAILANGMLLDSYWQLIVLSFINMVAVFFCISTVRLLNQRIPGGRLMQAIGDGTGTWSKSLYWFSAGLSTITPSILSIFFGSEFELHGLTHFFASFSSIVMGGGLASVFLLGVSWTKGRLIGSSDDHRFYFPFEAGNCDGWIYKIDVVTKADRIVKRFGTWLGLRDADYQFASYFAILASVHWLIARWLSVSEVWWTSAPSMVVVLIWITCMLFAGVANLFDKYRLPVVAIFLLAVTVWQIPWGSTRDLETVQDKSKNNFVVRIAAIKAAEDAFLRQGPTQIGETRYSVIANETKYLNSVAWEAIVNRMSKERVTPVDSTKGKTLVVVTCPGGGIHAAAWSACVLESISNEYSDFADSVGVISSVSGGSVGALFFLSSEYGSKKTGTVSKPSNGDIHESGIPKGSALDLAARSSLESIAYGMITDDLYGAFLPFLSLRDRGQRLEDSLSRRLPELQRNLTMGDWGDIAVEGEMPIVVFNSTDAATGRRVLFDTVPTPRRPSSVGLKSRPINYRELMEVRKTIAYDIKPATAVRTSATFPYVSPFTRPKNASPLGESVAICDGGYADNEGIVTAVNWVEFLLKKWAEPLLPGKSRPFDRILILRIEPNATVDLNRPQPHKGITTWMRWLFGPVESIINVRSASQVERGNLETDLAALYLEVATKRLPSEPEFQTGLTPRSSLEVFGSSGGNQSSLLARESAFQQHNATAQENREAWKKQLDAFKKRIHENPGSLEPKNAGPTKAVRPVDPNELHTNLAELPVIVQVVSFQNSDQVIPLNWKLSKEQKLWYLLSWELCFRSDSPLRKTLDTYFTPASK